MLGGNIGSGASGERMRCKHVKTFLKVKMDFPHVYVILLVVYTECPLGLEL
jgi:hypothetical protein